MQLVVDGRFVADEWVRDAGQAPRPVRPAARIVPWPCLEAGALAEGRLGVEVPNDVEAGALEPWFARLDLIAVGFPAMGDGRGFSLARALRARGYAGELRASGPLIADQYAFALGCGFDSVEIPPELAARQPAEQWTRALHRTRIAYQQGYRGHASILEARHRPPAAPGRSAAAASLIDSPALSQPLWWAHW